MHETVALFALLKSLGDGKVLDDLSQALSELTFAVRMTHKKGKVILTIEMEPGDVDVSKVDIEGYVKPVHPLLKRGGKTFYVTDQNGLSLRNPRQPNPEPNTINMASGLGYDLDGQSRAAGEKA